jgi:DNA-binding CsgD family transcriptional regulator
MGVKLTDSGSTVSMLRIQRSAAKGPFSEVDVRKMRARVATLSHAAQLYVAGMQRMRGQALAEAALDHLAIGVVIVDADRRLLFANAIADGVLSKSECLTVKDGRLAVRHRGADDALRRMIGNAANRRAGVETNGVLRVPDRRSGNFEISAAAITDGSDQVAGPRGAVLISIAKSGPSFDQLVARVAGRFRLTAAETAVADAIARGATVDSFAAERGITVNTVKTHLKAVFAKIGVRSKSDLVRLVLAGNASDTRLG